MKKLFLFVSTLLITFSAMAQSHLALNGRIVSMPSTIKVLVEKKDIDRFFNNTITRDNVKYKLGYNIDTDFIRSGIVFQNYKSVWLTYGGAQAGPKYLGQLREDYKFVVQTTTGVRRTVIIRAPINDKQFVSVFGSFKNNSRGLIDGISIDTSDSSLVEIR